jgi:hypothetical protein
MRRSPSESNGKLLTYNALKITIQPTRLESDKQSPEKGMQINFVIKFALFFNRGYFVAPTRFVLQNNL